MKSYCQYIHTFVLAKFESIHKAFGILRVRLAKHIHELDEGDRHLASFLEVDGEKLMPRRCIWLH